MNTPGTMTKIGAATHILSGIGAPINNHTVGGMVGWMNAEGGNWGNTAAYNPLNTTLDAPGARAINSAGVKAYNGWDQGIAATVQTLKQPNMAGIVGAFHSGNPQQIAHAIGTSPWGTDAGLVQRTIASATGQNYALPSMTAVAAQRARGATGNFTLERTPGSTSTDWAGALTDAMLSGGGKISDRSVGSGGLLSEAENLVNQGGYTVNTPGHAALRASGALGVAMAERASRDAAQVGGDAQKLLGMIHQVAGAAYNQGNHSAAGESASTVRKLGTDCSGFVSWLMGPGGLGIWNTSYATPSIDTAPGMTPGRGKQITVWNNKQAGNAGHVFIQIGNQYFASEGGTGIRQISSAEALGYIQHGSDGGTYQALHPQGL